WPTPYTPQRGLDRLDRIDANALDVAHRSRPAPRVADYFVDRPLSRELQHRRGNRLERKWNGLVVLLDEVTPWRPIVAQRLEHQPIENGADVAVDGRRTVAPRGDRGARRRDAPHLVVEARMVEPMQCLRDRHEIDRTVGERRRLGGRDEPSYSRVRRREGDLFAAEVGRCDFVEDFGERQGRLTAARAAVPRPAPALRDRRDVLEQLRRVTRSKGSIRSGHRREMIRRRAAAGHRTTATATPSCVGTMMPSTRGSVAMRLLNSRTPRVRSSAFSFSYTRPPHSALSPISRPPGRTRRSPHSKYVGSGSLSASRKIASNRSPSSDGSTSSARPTRTSTRSDSAARSTYRRAKVACASSISIERSLPPGGSARAMQIAEYPPSVPTSSTRRAPIAVSSTWRSRPSSAEIAIGGSPVRSAASRSEARSSSSAPNNPEMYSPALSDMAIRRRCPTPAADPCANRRGTQ